MVDSGVATVDTSSTTSTETTFIAADQNQVSFQVRAVTGLGNEGAWPRPVWLLKLGR